MKAILHWMAAAWVAVIGSVFILGLLAVICYLVYLAFTEWNSVLTGISALFAFLWISNWAGDYIDKHGWPWKPKQASERG